MAGVFDIEISDQLEQDKISDDEYIDVADVSLNKYFMIFVSHM
jgi:hypothetical protein